MKIPHWILNSPRRGLSAVTLVAGCLSYGQTAEVSSSVKEDEKITLSPFVVTSSANDYGYVATSSLSGGRLSTKLMDTPAAVSVLNRELLDDLGVNSVQEALQWTTNAFAITDADVDADSGGQISNGFPQSVFGPTSVRIRGVRNATLARNYFISVVDSDTYNTERIDVSRGPNALVFGDSALGGIVNVSTKRAGFRDFASLGYKITSYGGAGRVTLDVSRKLSSSLAVRINALSEDNDNWRDFGESKRKGLSLTTTWRPAPGTEIRLEGELARLNRIVPAGYLRDSATSWDFLTTRDTLTGAIPAGKGLAAAPAGSLLNFSRPELGFTSTSGMAITAAIATPIETGIPAGITGVVAAPVEAPAVLDGIKKFFVIPDYSFSTLGAASRFDGDYATASLFIERRFGQNLFVEIAGDMQNAATRSYIPNNGIRMLVDVNRLLPAGVTVNGSNQNPDFLKPYSLIDLMRIQKGELKNREARMTLIYELKGDWYKQRLGVLASSRTTDNLSYFRKLVRTNGTNPLLSNVGNTLLFRTNLDDRAKGPAISYDDDTSYSINGVEFAYRTFNGAGPASRTKTKLDSLQAFMSGSWFSSERLHTTAGIRRDRYSGDRFATTVFDATTGTLLRLDFTGNDAITVNSPSVGFVFKPTSRLSVYANTSKSFLVNSGGNPTLTDEVIPTRVGDGQDVGLRFELLDGRLSGSAGYYRSKEKNNVLNTPVSSINNIYDVIRNSSGNPQGLTARLDTQTAKATGYELDLTANFTRSWTLTANFGRPESTLTDGLPYTRQFVAENRAAWIAAAAAIGGTAPAAVATQLANQDAFIASFVDGSPVRNVRKYTANLFTRYRFATGRLQGLSVGGGVNLYGKNFLGQVNGLNTFGDSYYLTSAIIGYNRKIKGKELRLQLNISNVLDSESFAYVGFTATGTPTNYRVANPREFRLSADLKF